MKRMHHVPGLYLTILVLFIALMSCKQKEKQVSVKSKKSQPVAKKVPSQNPATGNVFHQLGLTEKEIRNSNFYSFVSDWYGVPYRYGGCKKTGVDCSCFVNLLYEQVYKKQISRSSAEIFKSSKQISLDDATEGDLLFFKIGGNTISHIGIYLKKKYFVHSSTSKGVIISSLDEAYYKKYFFSAGKIKEI